MIRITASEGKQYITSFAQLQSGQSISLDTTILSKEDVGNIYIAIITKRITVSSEDETKIRDKILSEGGGADLETLTPEELQNLAVKLISTGAFATEDGENTIESVSVNGYVLTPDINKNVNINISASGGGGINVVDYYPEDNVIITGPSIETLPNSSWDGEYLSSNNPEAIILSNNIQEIKYSSVKLSNLISDSLYIDYSSYTLTDILGIALTFSPEEINLEEVYYDAFISSTTTNYKYSIALISKSNSDFIVKGRAIHSLIGDFQFQPKVISNSGITLYFTNYIEYMIQVNGLTLEDLVQQVGQPAVDMYSSMNLIAIASGTGTLAQALDVLPIDVTASKMTISLLSGPSDIGSSETISSNSKLKIDANKKEYNLPVGLVDGNYLNIKEDVILLNTVLKKDDYFVLYSNLSKGIRIPKTETSVQLTGTFKGYNISQPSAENSVEGDWYLKDLWIQATTSYAQVIYVYVEETGWKLTGYIPNTSSLDIIYDSSSNRIKGPNGYPTAGYLGVYYSGNTPSLGSTAQEQSLIYDASLKTFRYTSGGQWWTIGTPLFASDIITQISDSEYTSGLPSGEAIKTYVTNKEIPWNKIINKPWAGGIEPYPLDLLITKECNFDSTANDWVISGATKSLVTYTNEPSTKNRLLQNTEIHFPIDLNFKGSLDLLTSMVSGDSFSFLLGVASGGGDPTYLEIIKTDSSFIINKKNSSGNVFQSATLSIPNIDGRRGFRLEYLGGLKVKMSLYWMNNNSEIVKQTIFEDMGYQINGTLTLKGISGATTIHRITGRN